MSRKNPRRAPGGAGAPVSDADLARHARAAEEAERVAELESWVGTWLSLPEAADRQGVPLAAVRRQLQDRELVAVRRGPNRALAIPEAFVTPAGPRGDLRGTFTVLADGGMDDVELLGWLFAPDDSFEEGARWGRSWPDARPRCGAGPWRRPSDGSLAGSPSPVGTPVPARQLSRAVATSTSPSSP